MMISGIKYYKQNDPDYCVPTCASMMLGTFGIDVTQEEIGNIVMKKNMSNNLRRTFTYDMCSYLVQHGVYPISFANLPDDEAWNLLIRYIKQNTPVMVSQNFSEKSPAGHFRVVIGYDVIGKFNTEIVYYHDPSSGPHQSMKKETFMKLWSPSGVPNSELRTKNQMVILQKTPSNFMKKKCMFCGGIKIKTSLIDNEKKYPEFQFINSNAKIDKNGTSYGCESCRSVAIHFEP